VNWKTDLKLSDLDAMAEIEVVCKRCKLVRYVTPAQLLERVDFKNAYLDEIEYSLHCSDRFCRGGVRIALIHDDKTEGFVGGMA
jgi:transcription elongation factor Elf1